MTGTGQTRRQALDTNEYMDIDEFIDVLREVELITPFGKVQGTSVHQIGFETQELLTPHEERSDYRSGRTIPQTPVVLQVLETERRLRDIDTETSNALPYSKQQSEQIVEDSEMTNYLLLLLKT